MSLFRNTANKHFASLCQHSRHSSSTSIPFSLLETPRMKNTLVVLVVVCTIAASWISPVSAVLGSASLEVQGTGSACLNGFERHTGTSWRWRMELDKNYRYIFTRVSIADCPSLVPGAGLVFIVKNVGSLGNICARTGPCTAIGGGLHTCIGYATIPSYDNVNGGTRCGEIHPVQYCLNSDCHPDTGRDIIPHSPPFTVSTAGALSTHVMGVSFPKGCSLPFDATCRPPLSHLGNTV